MNNRNIPGTRNQIEEKAPQSRREERRLHNRKRAQQREILQTALLLAAAVILLCLSFVEGGGPWRAIHNIFRGLFGGYAPLWAVIPGGLVVLSAFDQKHNVRRSTFSLGVCVVIFALCTASFVFSLDQNFGEFSYLQNMGQLYLDGIAGNGAGSVGGLLGLPIFGLLGATGAKIVIILLFLAAILIFVIKKIGGLDLGTNDREPVPEREARQPEPFTRQEPSRRASVRQPQESPRRPEPQIHTPRMTSIDVPIDPEPAAVRPSGKPAAAESSKPAALEELEKELDRFIAEPIPVRSAPKAAAPVGNTVTAPPKVSSVQQVRTSQVRPQPSKPVYISPYTASRPSVISQPASQKTNPVVTTPAAASASPVSRPADPVPDKQPEKAESPQETVPAEKESIWKILTETADNQAASGEPPVIRIPEYQGEEPEIPQEESMTESASEAEDQREILNEINAVLDDSVPAGDFEPETRNFPPIQRVSVESVPVEPVSMDEKQSASLDAPAEVPEISQQSSSDVPDPEQPVGQESLEAEQEPAPESYPETAASVSDSDLSMETSETVRDFPQPIDESEQDDFDDFEDDAEDNFFGAISAALDGIGFSIPEDVDIPNPDPVETPEPEASEEVPPTLEESVETPEPEVTEEAVPTPDQSTETPEPEAPEEAALTSEESAETSEPEASEETASIPEESVKTPNSEESEEAVSTIEEVPEPQETEIPQEPAVSEEQDPWEKIPAAVQEIPMEIDLQPEPEEAPAKDFEPDPWEEVPAGKAESISDEANSPAEVTDEVTEKSAGENSEEDPWADIPEGTEKEKSSAAPETTPYQRPPASLLEYSVQQDDAQMQEELQTNGDHLIDTLKSFGVQATMLDISRGPAVTRYELQPAAGVKISKITNLADDIAMNLAAPGVRIEAPIPGKAAVGIEVPNKKVNTVRMRELVESKEFLEAESPLTVALGRDIAGKITLANLAKMPHLLIAGSTGSGKSVCINSLIVSLLYKSSPDQVRFLMIDPKVVELGIYNGIPQLLVPVVTDPRKAAGALNWAVSEMLKRYQLFADNSVRDLGAYNRLAKENGYQDDDGQPMPALPQIVIIIDELADLMMAAPNDVENAICRLAQMARAAGMHLVIATQRPSVDVITGIIKANIPSRIAFAVSSQIDSRTILDMGGAEKLLGRGDMLFSPMGVQKPMRVQGCFVSDGEIESVVKFVKGTQDALYDSTILDEIERSAVQENEKSTDDDSSGGDMDPMLQDAIKCVAEAGQASASLLQRRLRLGYARAGRLIDEMEDMGIIGPREGSKPRQVLITYQQYLEMSVNREE